MPQVPIIMPQLGESIAEATIVNWLVKEGAIVEADQDVLEVETNKATMNVAAPCRGRVEKWLAKLNESYPGRGRSRPARRHRGGSRAHRTR
jgi:pyruvate dehydrogenase E2 component (dihydrolipoamide acetyltransferase)